MYSLEQPNQKNQLTPEFNQAGIIPKIAPILHLWKILDFRERKTRPLLYIGPKKNKGRHTGGVHMRINQVRLCWSGCCSSHNTVVAAGRGYFEAPKEACQLSMLEAFFSSQNFTWTLQSLLWFAFNMDLHSGQNRLPSNLSLKIWHISSPNFGVGELLTDKFDNFQQ